MFNKPCIKCDQPMNGGVYRKPNLCPHCFSIQDTSLTLRNKPLIMVNEAVGAEAALEETAPAFAATVYAETNSEAVVTQPSSSIDSDRNQAQSVDTTFAITEAVAPSTDLAPQAQATDVEAEIICDAETVFCSETAAEAEEADLFDADVNVDIGDLYLDDLQMQAKTLAEKIAFEAAQPAPAFDEDEALYDDHSGIDDDFLFSDEADATNSASVATASTAETSTVSSSAGIASGQLPAAIKESLDISLKITPTAEAIEAKTCSSDVPPPQPKNLGHTSVREIKTTSPIHFQSKQAVAVNAQEKEPSSDYESIVLTTETARDIKVDMLLDIVTAECVFETSMMKSNFPKTKKHSDQDERPSINVLKDARKTVLDTLKKDAYTLGANTVIGLKLKYTEISHGNEAMMLVVATGTAVKVATAKVAQVCEA